MIGSADWMHRNLEERVEAVVPVEERGLRQRLWDILQTMLDDRRQAWDMQSDGSYRQRQPLDDVTSLGTQQVLMQRALVRASRR